MNNETSVEGGLTGDALNGAEFVDNGVILVDKPAGISSFGVVAKVRGMLKTRLGRKVKVGHTGTLDPFATGLLILLYGKMTKKSSDFLKLDKEYIATMKLGYTSSTGDPEGEIQKYPNEGFAEQIQSYSTRGASGRPVATGGRRYSSPCQAPDPLRLNMIESAIKSFVGKIEQAPPRYSAIKINGQRAYKLARKGAEFEMPSREVEIYKIEILKYEWPELTIRCAVSSGTYIRTLAEDIGARLGVGAYLTALRRTKVGKYDVKDAVSLDELCNVGMVGV